MRYVRRDGKGSFIENLKSPPHLQHGHYYPLILQKNRIPANYNVGGLQMADTIQKFKCLSIEANFKLLQNVLKNKNDFISLT